MQIKVESFGVAYEVKVKKIIEKQSCKRNWRKKVTIKSRSAWLLLMIWFLSKEGKSLIGKLQEEMELSVSGLKKSTKFHERTAFQLNNILNGNEQLADWLTYGRTVLCQKNRTKKGNAVKNYRPISCLPLLRKLLTGITSEHLHHFLEEENILSKEQKGCKSNSRGTKDQLLLDKAVLRDCKRRITNLAMARIDYRKAYDMIPLEIF